MSTFSLSLGSGLFMTLSDGVSSTGMVVVSELSSLSSTAVTWPMAFPSFLLLSNRPSTVKYTKK